MIAEHAGRKRKKKPLNSRVTGRIDEETKQRIGAVAEKTGLDESDLVRLALSQYLPLWEGKGEQVAPGAHLVDTEAGLQVHQSAGVAPECAADREIEQPGELAGERDSNKAESRRQKEEGGAA